MGRKAQKSGTIPGRTAADRAGQSGKGRYAGKCTRADRSSRGQGNPCAAHGDFEFMTEIFRNYIFKKEIAK